MAIKAKNIRYVKSSPFGTRDRDHIEAAVNRFNIDSYKNKARNRLDELFTINNKAAEAAVQNPSLVQSILCKRELVRFVREFWHVINDDDLIENWHMEYICSELQALAENVGDRKPKEYDLIINIPPGTTKSTMVSIMFPAWCWTRWPWMKFIGTSYSADLSLEHAEACREVVRSPKYREFYPYIRIKKDKDTKSNFKIMYRKDPHRDQLHGIDDDTSYGTYWKVGGGRFSTSVGGTIMGFHAHILLVDDPIDPKGSRSEKELKAANDFMDKTLPSRKADKDITPTVLIMQRLHEDDPTGHWLDKGKSNLRHICLPCDSDRFGQYIKPRELACRYVNNLMDPNRLSRDVLDDLELEMGTLEFSGQFGENPTPPEGGMFKVGKLLIVDSRPNPAQIMDTIRYWDKAATRTIEGKFTCGAKMSKLVNGTYLIEDIKRGRWSTDERDRIIRQTAEIDGKGVTQFHEQEPGSGGKESAENTIKDLAGFKTYADRPVGDKTRRADPYSSQVNAGNVLMLRGEWNRVYRDELAAFPYGRYKDQVDASAAAFAKLASKRLVRRIR